MSTRKNISAVVKSLLLACAMLWPVIGAPQVVPLDPLIHVNEGVSGGGSARVALTDRDGSFVVVWKSTTGNILGQRFNAAGDPVGEVFQVNTSPDYIWHLDVAGDLSGNFVVVWQYGFDDLSESAVYSRRFDGQGALDPAQVLIVEDPIQGHDYLPSVARDPSSEYVIVWQHDCAISGQQFGGDGIELGEVFEISTPGTSPYDGSHFCHWRASVAKDPSGNFVVGWQCGGCEDFDDDEEGDQRIDIRARQYDSNAIPMADEFSVNIDTDGYQEYPSVAVGVSGDFVVVWTEDSSDTAFGKLYQSTGITLIEDFQINSAPSAPGFMDRLDVAARDPDGHFMVTWDGSGRWFDDNCVPWADDFRIADDPWVAWNPSVAGDVHGNYVVAWEGPGPGDDDGIWARLYRRPALIVINDLSVIEGNDQPLESTAVFTVEASDEHPDGVTVDYDRADGTATYFEDYLVPNGSLAFAADPSDLTRDIVVDIVGDLVFEPDEIFYMILGNTANAAITKGQGTGTILNDDQPPGITIEDRPAIDEDAGIVLFSVELNQSLAATASVDYATSDGTATAGSDYEAVSGTLSYPPGTTHGFIAVEIIDDSSSEDAETFHIDLSAPVNALILDGQGVGTIIDNDCEVATTIDPGESEWFDPDGGIGSFEVIDVADCGWTAVSNQPAWIEVTSPPGGVGSGNGTVEYAVAANGDDFPRDGSISIAGLEFVVHQEGVLCVFSIVPENASFESGGGSGSVAVIDPETCGWSAESNDPWISVTSATGSPGNGVVEYSVTANPGVPRTGTMTIAGQTFTVDQGGIFFDDFDDDVLAMDWEYEAIELWEEANDSLRADAVGTRQTARALATWAFSGCIKGTITTRMRVNVFSTGTAVLYGWYGDPDNFVSLTMNEFANAWTLTQRVGGVDVQTASSNILTIETHVVYDVELSFDGGGFIATVDEVQIISMPMEPGSMPDGTVGFEVTDTDADFDEISATTVTTSSIFMDGFESGDTTAWSTTVP